MFGGCAPEQAPPPMRRGEHRQRLKFNRRIYRGTVKNVPYRVLAEIALKKQRGYSGRGEAPAEYSPSREGTLNQTETQTREGVGGGL